MSSPRDNSNRNVNQPHRNDNSPQQGNDREQAIQEDEHRSHSDRNDLSTCEQIERHRLPPPTRRLVGDSEYLTDEAAQPPRFAIFCTPCQRPRTGRPQHTYSTSIFRRTDDETAGTDANELTEPASRDLRRPRRPQRSHHLTATRGEAEHDTQNVASRTLQRLKRHPYRTPHRYTQPPRPSSSDAEDEDLSDLSDYYDPSRDSYLGQQLPQQQHVGRRPLSTTHDSTLYKAAQKYSAPSILQPFGPLIVRRSSQSDGRLIVETGFYVEVTEPSGFTPAQRSPRLQRPTPRPPRRNNEDYVIHTDRLLTSTATAAASRPPSTSTPSAADAPQTGETNARQESKRDTDE